MNSNLQHRRARKDADNTDYNKGPQLPASEPTLNLSPKILIWIYELLLGSALKDNREHPDIDRGQPNDKLERRVD